jgi:hypothetical protein
MMETKNDLEGLVRLFIADGLPPNIKVLRVGVHEGAEGQLVLNMPYSSTRPELTPEEEKAIGLKKEDTELQEFTVDGIRVLAGFSQLGYTLIIGVFDLYSTLYDL